MIRQEQNVSFNLTYIDYSKHILKRHIGEEKK